MAIDTSSFKSTACNLCFVNCGIKVELGGDDGRQFLRIVGDDEHPTSQGYICNKASRLNYYQNNAARLTSPMRRREDGSYEAVSWDTAIAEVAAKLAEVREKHGGERIFYYGGGGQGNHMVGASAQSLRNALDVKFKGNAISQEKTGLAWVMSRMIGGMVHPELHHAEVAMIVGKNPFMSNGLDKARNLLRDFRKDENRKLIVVDPRTTETADYADLHLAVAPGRDAWCMAAILGQIVQSNRLPLDWLAEHANGYEAAIEVLAQVPVAEYAEFAGLTLGEIEEAADLIAGAKSFTLEEDLGVQMAPHSTLVSYLNHLLMLLTGNFGRPGTLGMVTQLAPVIPQHRSKLDDSGREVGMQSLPVTGAPIISGLYPGAFLAEEILNDSPERPRALIVESSNPVHSLPGSAQLREAIRSLEFSVAVDIAMTETAMECDYVLPVHSQYEKWEATFFPRNFPENIFYLREPLLAPQGDTLTEQELHARLIEALGVFEPGELAELEAAAAEGFGAYRDAFFAAMGSNPKVGNMLSYVLYRTLGPALGEGREATALLWGLCQMHAMKNSVQLARAGYEGADAGDRLFMALLESDTAITIGVSDYAESFSELPFPDQKLQLAIPELLEELASLSGMQPLMETSEDYPFALMAGARRAYTANCAIRDPRWLKGKHATALTMHPDDAARSQLEEGSRVRLETEAGVALVDLALDDRLKPGTLAVPNGQGMHFVDEDGNELDGGVFANELTSPHYRDRFAGTPFHKFVPARVSPASASA